MGSPESQQHQDEITPAVSSQFTGAVDPDETQAWEEVSSGRYMPRRIKGSYKGRALG